MTFSREEWDCLKSDFETVRREIYLKDCEATIALCRLYSALRLCGEIQLGEAVIETNNHLESLQNISWLLSGENQEDALLETRRYLANKIDRQKSKMGLK
jgi:hypothetical protein